MHKIIASLLLALAAAALLSPRAASSRLGADTALLTTRAFGASGVLEEREDAASVGDYFDLHLQDGLLLSVRLAALDAREAQIDTIVVRDGRTLAEPSLRVARDDTASLTLTEPQLTLQFEVH